MDTDLMHQPDCLAKSCTSYQITILISSIAVLVEKAASAGKRRAGTHSCTMKYTSASGRMMGEDTLYASAIVKISIIVPIS